MSWLLNELSPIDVNCGAEVYKFNSNETPTDTNKTFVRICQEKRQGMCAGACVCMHGRGRAWGAFVNVNV